MLKTSRNEKIEKKLLIMVEGKDDKLFFDALLMHLDLDKSLVDIISVEGKDRFPKEIKALPKIPGFFLLEKIIFVRDADENYEGAFQSMRDALKRNKFPYPRTTGTFSAQKNKLRTAIYIMPKEQENGAIEDLCLASIGEEEQKCIEQTMACMPSQPKKNKLAKGKTLVFLGTRERPVNTLGIAAYENYWNFNHSCFENLNCLLQNLMT